jgi:hypothetical protein
MIQTALIVTRVDASLERWSCMEQFMYLYDIQHTSMEDQQALVLPHRSKRKLSEESVHQVKMFIDKINNKFKALQCSLKRDSIQ